MVFLYPFGTHEFIPLCSGIRVTRSLVLCVCFVDRFFLFLFCTFSFGHCVICPSSIYGFDYRFGIFKLFSLEKTAV